MVVARCGRLLVSFDDFPVCCRLMLMCVVVYGRLLLVLFVLLLLFSCVVVCLASCCCWLFDVSCLSFGCYFLLRLFSVCCCSSLCVVCGCPLIVVDCCLLFDVVCGCLLCTVACWCLFALSFAVVCWIGVFVCCYVFVARGCSLLLFVVWLCVGLFCLFGAVCFVFVC